MSCNGRLTCPLLRSSQEGIQTSQKRIEDGVSESRDLLMKSSGDHMLQLESLSDHLEKSQSRIEAQLQTILTNQQRTRTPIMSHSLDASSPEGRQTWMELGRLLRDEGITPAMIRENREILVNAMKGTLKNETLAESVPESYATAPEYNSNNPTLSVTEERNAWHRGFTPTLSPMSLLGSAPPRSAGFTDAFLERQNAPTSSLDQRQNVDSGMRSLLEGMSDDGSTVQREHNDMDDVNLGNLELEEYSSDADSVDYEQRQSQDGRDVVERLVPTSERGEPSREREGEGAGNASEVPGGEPDEPNERWAVDATPREARLTASDVTGKDRDNDEDIIGVSGSEIFRKSLELHDASMGPYCNPVGLNFEEVL